MAGDRHRDRLQETVKGPQDEFCGPRVQVETYPPSRFVIQRSDLRDTLFGVLGNLVPVLAATILLMAQSHGWTLMPGDTIKVTSQEIPIFNVERTVCEDGTIDIPEIGRIPGATRSLDAVATRIELEASRQLHWPGSRVHVEVVVRPYSPISISGAVRHSILGRFPHGVSLRTLLKGAEPTDEADLASVVIQQANVSDRVVDTLAADATLNPGDRVVVGLAGTGGQVSVVGGVVSPTALRFRRALTLGDAIDRAGGLSVHGDPLRVSIERRNERVPATWPADRSFPLASGDTIRVDLRPDRKFVMVVGLVNSPGLVEFAPGMTLSQAMKSAGGVKTVGHPADTVIVRNGATTAGRPAVLSLAFLKAGRIPDISLIADDVIEIVVGKAR